MTRQQGPARSSSLKGCAIYYVFLMETLKGIRKKKLFSFFKITSLLPNASSSTSSIFSAGVAGAYPSYCRVKAGTVV